LRAAGVVQEKSIGNERIATYLKQIEEFIHGKSGGSDQSAQGARRKFGVLGNGEIGANIRLRQNQVAPDLTADLPTSFLKSLRGVLARNV
jgi:hypothetical protein